MHTFGFWDEEPSANEHGEAEAGKDEVGTAHQRSVTRAFDCSLSF
jgi:hypothetical protein